MRLNRTRGSQVCDSFYFSFFLRTGLHAPEALSGSRPAEFTMQQLGKDKGYNEYTGGLHYEHFYTPIRSLPLEGDMFNSLTPCLPHYLYRSASIAEFLE